MVYVYRLEGYDKDWRQTREGSVEYTHLPRGEYVFQVKAADRDLAYSEESVEVRVTTHPPSPYGRMALIGGLGVALVSLAIVSGYAVRRRRDLRRTEQALMQELEKELQTAHDMQMGLMPKEHPQIEGFDIAGRCVPMNHVGGDYFQYFDRSRKLFLSLADVTGHAMDAAIPAVMFSGILENQMESDMGLEELFGRLNRSLHRILERRTFICFAMGELGLSTGTFRLSNGGCPPPYHYRASTGELIELEVSAGPLGVRPDRVYEVVEAELQSGDRVVFCSDGIAEAMDASEEVFGYDRTEEMIRRVCAEDLSAEGMIDRILSEVDAFRGDTPQSDDMTLVVLKVS